MTTTLLLLLLPLALAAILTALAPTAVHRRTRPRAAVVRTTRSAGPRHARAAR
ncbi:hypothetical protein ACFXPX_43100 [Kitasatospora sp. NPDC059146]|uniref:hypothetical protein n=1 Tax=unclassified Kitasatospora TaxID=2633591 RepID=UPI0036CE4BC2